MSTRSFILIVLASPVPPIGNTILRMLQAPDHALEMGRCGRKSIVTRYQLDTAAYGYLSA